MNGRRYRPPLSTSVFPPLSKTRSWEGKYVLGCLVLMWVTLPSTVWATHEANHRYNVYGYVRDAKGQAVQDVKVMVVDNRIGEGSTTFTDKNGYYEVLLHLHDSNLGDEVTITTPDETKTIVTQFDPQDHMTERKVQVDFGAPPPAGTSSNIVTLWMYGTGAALVIVAFVYWRRMHSRKQVKAQSQGWKKGKKK
ncbi:MAG: carboxypeptidase-like regulatory domain-containing protein [Nitrospira sp.]|nr:carboxypeptidase-like regulatory domain-containing protein [Nitrospira sp.]